MDTWTVGELAAATGLTTRTLRHYDAIGLARPSRRSATGHRQYSAGDVRRLHQIVALRGFGFSLAEIGGLLDAAAPDPRELLQRQLDQADDRIRKTTRLRDQLEAALEQLTAADDPSAAMLVRLIEEMTAVDQKYTPEQIEELAACRRELLAQLTPVELAEMSARRAAWRQSLPPEQLAELSRSRHLLPDRPPEAGPERP